MTYLVEGCSPVLTYKNVTVNVGDSAVDGEQQTKTTLQIKGFMSVSSIDRHQESVDPSAFDLNQFRKNMQLWIDHKKWLRSDGNDVPIGVVDTIDPVVVERGEGGDLNVVSLDTDEVLGVVNSEEFLVNSGDRGIWISASVQEEDVIDMIEDGRYKSFSWQGIAEQNPRTGEITKVDLMEVSVVSIPANPKASFVIAKSLSPLGSGEAFDVSQFTIANDGTISELSILNDTEKGAIGVHNTGTSTKAWNADEHKKRLKEDQVATYYKHMYTWFDSDKDTKVKGTYKFPHHEVSKSGTIGDANLAACNATIANLNGARTPADIPAEDREGVYRHVASHLKSAGKDPVKLKSVDDIVDTEWSDTKFVICGISSDGEVTKYKSDTLKGARTSAIELLELESVRKTVILSNTGTSVDGNTVFESVDMFTTMLCADESSSDFVKLSAAEACALGFGVEDTPGEVEENLKGGDIEMTVEEMKAAFTEVLAPIIDRIDTLEKGIEDDTEDIDPDEDDEKDEPEKTEDGLDKPEDNEDDDKSDEPVDTDEDTSDGEDLTKAVEEALTKGMKQVIKPITDRLDRMERKPAKKAALGDDEVIVKKSAVVPLTPEEKREQNKRAASRAMIPPDVRERRVS
jgi:hypothetical protein